MISQAQLPKEAQNFSSKYLSADKVRKIEKAQGHSGMEYEVDFISGAEVEFLMQIYKYGCLLVLLIGVGIKNANNCRNRIFRQVQPSLAIQ